MLGWRGSAWRRGRGLDDGVEMGSVRGVRCRVVSAVRRFRGSQGWMVPGGSVPVYGSVRGLPVSCDMSCNCLRGGEFGPYPTQGPLGSEISKV